MRYLGSGSGHRFGLLPMLLYIVCLLSVLSACESHTEIEEEEIKTEPIVFETQNKDINVSASDTLATVIFVASKQWEIEIVSEENTDWLSLSVLNGELGRISLDVVIKENESVKGRLAILKIQAGGKQYEIKVTQAGGEPNAIYLSVLSVEVDYLKNEFKIEVKANTQWRILDVPTWLNVVPLKGDKDGFINIVCAVNTLLIERKAILKFVAGDALAELSITQKAYESSSTIYLSKKVHVIDSKAKTITLDVVSNSKWNTSGIPDWLTISPSEGDGSCQVAIECKENVQIEDRDAVIIFNAGTATDDITITQKGIVVEQPSISLDISLLNVNYLSGEFYVKVSSRFPWSVSEVSDWLSVTPESGDGDKLVKVQYLENKRDYSRNGSIIFHSNGVTQKLEIKQGYNIVYTLKLSQNSILLNTEEGSFTFDVLSNTTWSVDPVPDWLKLSITQGEGDTTVKVNFEANKANKNRSEHLRFRAGNIIDVISVYQNIKQLPDFNEDEI